MKKTKFRTYLWRVLFLVLVVLTTAGVVVGKYMTTFTAGSGTVTVSAKLAGSLAVQEHKAQRQSDGTYTLSATETVTTNAYILMPGVDIPKDPRVVITGKTEIPAYLYLTVDCTNDAITYTLADHWVQVDGGDTYVYADAYGEPIPLTATPEGIAVLKDDTVYVTHELLGKSKSTDPIKFTATLKEVVN